MPEFDEWLSGGLMENLNPVPRFLHPSIVGSPTPSPVVTLSEWRTAPPDGPFEGVGAPARQRPDCFQRDAVIGERPPAVRR
ncbi:hypothetical protein AAFF_G00339810 [Aldrovandia affinis]|uniref:Uncharacterized protein n=1 Tax=Aldrovandia affinis TaxID=143900 RepID=A0AAD7SL08_9TELE|nr:hypothetical protein AAFF_G00339810 [Aldrovandia affinis]